jgi:uncharacterized protein
LHVTEAVATPRPSDDGRLDVVDVVRGFALTGLFLVHMIESYELFWAGTPPKTDAISDTVFLLFMGKSFSMLALCFGFSFFILMDRAARRGVDFTGRFAWRLTVLIGIGTLHSWIYRGDIIQLLAGMGFLLLLAHRIRDNRVLIGLAVFFFLGPVMIVTLVAAMAGAAWANGSPMHWVDPAMQVYVHGDFWAFLRANLWAGQAPKWWFMLETGRMLQIVGLYLVGMVLGRTGFFARLGEFARARWIALAIAAVAAPILYFIREPLAQALLAAGYSEAAARTLRYLLGSWFELTGMTIWVLLLMAVYQSAARWLVLPFAGIGRLTLTLYVAQSVVFIPIFYGWGLGLHDDWNTGMRLVVGLVAVAAQMAFAAWWLARFHYGPLEWVWRALTYRSSDVPFLRNREG